MKNKKYKAITALLVFLLGSGYLAVTEVQPLTGFVTKLEQFVSKNKLSEQSSEVKSPNGTRTSVEVKASNEVETDDTWLTLADKWSLGDYPDYYTVVGVSNVDLPSLDADSSGKGVLHYSDLDNLGRTGSAYATLTYENVKGSYGVRQQFSSDDDPSGWTYNAKVALTKADGKVYHGYFWNRSHLIGDALGGDAERVNVITGTRPQNVGNGDGGMRYSEIKAQKWLENNHSGYLYYSNTPIYKGNELVPRGNVVKMLSSDGSIDETVFVFNTANGFTIDYSDGTFSKN